MKYFVAAPLLLAAVSSQAADLRVEFVVPAMKVAEYHRPYVAVWIENDQRQAVNTLAVWHEQGKKYKWLKDLSQWWRRVGRDLDGPIDGVSGATRLPGTYLLQWQGVDQQGQALPAGQYTLSVEVVREVGDRELQRVSFDWPPAETHTEQLQGKTELGQVTLQLTP